MKAVTKVLVCFAVSVLSVLVVDPVEGQEALRHLDVVGEAEVRAAPDQAVVTLGVESWNQDLALARKDNDGRMAKLLTVPGRFGIAAKDVRTDFASIDPQYETTERGQLRAIAGYRLTNVVVVRIADLTQVGPFVTAALGAGANRLDGVSFGLANPAAVKAEARTAAVKDALAKARALASALGQSVGRPLSVSESSSSPYPGPAFKAMAAPMALESSGAGDVFAPGQVLVSAQVAVSFELKD